MSATQVVEAMAKVRFPGLRLFVAGRINEVRHEEYVWVRLTIQESHYYVGDFFKGEQDNRDYMLHASMLLDRMEREIYKRYGILVRYPISRKMRDKWDDGAGSIGACNGREDNNKTA